jgi:hypothetical protein
MAHLPILISSDSGGQQRRMFRLLHGAGQWDAPAAMFSEFSV